MSGSGREVLPEVREWSGGALECKGVVGWSSRMSGNGREAFRFVREWSGGPPGIPGVVWRPSWKSEWWGEPPGCPEEGGKTSRMCGSGREALRYVREWSGGTPG